MRPVRKAQKEPRSWVLPLLACLLLLGVIGWGYTQYSNHPTDRFRHIRIVKEDLSAVPEDLFLAEDGSSLSSERFFGVGEKRYGVDGVPVEGASFEVACETRENSKSGKLLRPVETFILPPCKGICSGGNTGRNADLRIQKEKYKKFMSRCLAPVDRKAGLAVIVDATDGVDTLLADSVKHESGSLLPLASSVRVGTFKIMERASQIDRRWRATDAKGLELEAQLGWVTQKSDEEKGSAFLEALPPILRDIVREKKAEGLERMTALLWSDGLQNNATFSFYSVPAELLAPGKEVELDQYIDEALDKHLKLTGIDLTGVEVHLYPLPTIPEKYELLMSRVLHKLAERLVQINATAEVHLIDDASATLPVAPSAEPITWDTTFSEPTV